MSEIELKDAYIVGELRHIVATGEGDMLWINRHHAAALLSAIDSPTTQWQPIETAPKDLSAFLAGEFYFVDGECNYKEFSTAYRYHDGRVHCYDENVTPTHWQPLPAGPEVPNVND